MGITSSLKPPIPSGDVTRLLRSWSGGDPQAAQEAVALLYDELRRIARCLARGERRDHTLEPTAIVHEAWIQLAGPHGVQSFGTEWDNRDHFLGVAARAMRQILVDHARRRGTAKRGNGLQRTPLFAEAGAVQPTAANILSLHFALERLERFAALEAQVVELRFFGGLTLDETAEFVGLSRRTVVRIWRRARAWLRSELTDGSRPEDNRPQELSTEH